MIYRFTCIVFAIVTVATSLPAVAGQPRATGTTVWMSPGRSTRFWGKKGSDPFPVKMLVADLARLGVSEILFFEQKGRGGPFYHPTAVANAATSSYLRGRDYLEELLDETDQHAMKVWLAWTPPSGPYPGTEIEGLNHPGMLRIYTGEIEEVAANYGRHASLAGVMWHEVDCTEAVDSHADDVAEFAAYCRREFGEAYPGEKMPSAEAENRWWRRFFLYKNHVVNSFVGATAAVARKHGLRTHFCSYVPEAYPGDSWRWGYDVVALEKICDCQWFAGYVEESCKPYQEVKGARIDFGPSYRNQILARNYAYALHGKPVSYFEYRTPVYLNQVRQFYTSIKDFTKQHGDFYKGYMGLAQTEIDLFYGIENLERWLGLMRRWQGGTSTARVAVAVHPNEFIMRNPLGTGYRYDQKVRTLMLALSAVTDVDGLLLESRYSLDPRNLLRYSMIIIPEDMGAGLSPPMIESLRKYEAGGGRLLVIVTPLGTSRPDLTRPTDLTRGFCGLEITKSGLPGYVTLAGGPFPVEPEAFWAPSLKRVNLHGAEVLLKHRDTDRPALTRKGNVFFSTVGCGPESVWVFSGIVRHMLRPPIALGQNTGLRILEGVGKDGMLCLTLWGQGKALLQVDAARLGCKESSYHVRELLTGATLGDFSAGQLGEGIPVEIEHLYQPLVIAIGKKESLDAFQALYPSAQVFQGMTPRQADANPEVPRELSDAGRTVGPVPRDKEIGIVEYALKFEVAPKRRTTAKDHYVWQAAQKAKLAPEVIDVDIFLPNHRAERNRFKRIYIPTGSEWFTQAMYQGMHEYVREGGLLLTNTGLLLLDANANYRVDEPDKITHYARDTFLGIRAHASATIRRIKVLQTCPLTVGIPAGDWISLSPVAGGRQARNQSAQIVAMSDRVTKKRPDTEQPLLTYQHTGRGACVYLVAQIGKEPDKNLAQVLANLLSPETLDWLCRPR